MVAIDLDDTLLEADLTLSKECVSTLRRAQEAGVKVVIATGRMFRATLPIALELGLDGYLITYNGALIRSVSGETVWHRPVPADQAKEMIAIASEMDFRLNFYIDDNLVVDGIDERVEYYLQIAQVEPQVVDDLAEVLVHGRADQVPPCGRRRAGGGSRARAASPFPELQIARSRPRFIEVTRRGVRKEVGVAKVAELYGIADGGRDGHRRRRQRCLDAGDAGFGVAVANASAKAKAAADLVTAGERGAGVCEAVRRFVLEA